MPAELHLPDLPEVAVSLGMPPSPSPSPSAPAPAGTPRQAPALGWRVRNALSAYLPLLLMALLAAGTAWLVKNTPGAGSPPGASAPRKEPDYTMQGFSIVRFGPDGRASIRIEGQRLRHFPDTDRIEIDGVRIHAIGDGGRVTDASADRALANGDASEVQLIGSAKVRSQLAGQDVLEIDSEFLHAFTRFERLRSNQPVRVRRGANDMRAGGLDLDNLNQQMQLAGPVHMLLVPGRPK